jgi:hypothetical protein
MAASVSRLMSTAKNMVAPEPEAAAPAAPAAPLSGLGELGVEVGWALAGPAARTGWAVAVAGA